VLTAVKAGLAMYGQTEARSAEQRGKDFDEVEGELRVRAENTVRRATETLDGDVAVEADAFVEDPADVLIRVSENLDLLICGSRGYGPVRSLLLGGVTSTLAHTSACPLLVVPRAPVPGFRALAGGSAR
jgi:nucleotide-binding universal stress UspA family protein